MPDEVSVPQPEAGLRLHVTPPPEVSLVTAAVRATADAPAFTVVVVPACDSETEMELLPLLLELFPPPPPQAVKPPIKTITAKAGTIERLSIALIMSPIFRFWLSLRRQFHLTFWCAQSARYFGFVVSVRRTFS